MITGLMLTAVALVAGAGAYPAGGDDPDGQPERQVSQAQYDILIAQCRYAGTRAGRHACEAEVDETYRIGDPDSELDCRRYVGVTVCGTLELSASERACVADSVAKGLSRRRAEVECYVYY